MEKRHLYFTFSIIVIINLAFTAPLFTVSKEPIISDSGDLWTGYYPVDVGAKIFSAWSVELFGRPSNRGMGQLLEYGLQLLTGSAWLSQLLVLFGFFWAASLSMCILIVKGKLSNSVIVTVLASIVYAYNHATLSRLQTWWLGVYACIPLVLLFALRIFLNEGRHLSNIIGLALSLTMGSLFFGFQTLALLLPFFLVALITGFLIETGKMTKRVRHLVFSIGLISASIVLYTLLVLPAAYRPVSILLSHGLAGYAQQVSGGTLAGTISPLQFLFYVPIMFPYLISPLITLSSPSLGTSLPTVEYMLESNSFGILGFVLPAITFMALFLKEKRKKAIVISLFIVYIPILVLLILAQQRSNLINTLYNSFPILHILEAASDYLLVLSAIQAILLTLGLDFALEKVASMKHEKPKSLRKRIVKVSAMMCLIIIVALPVFSSHDYLVFNFDRIYNRTYIGATGGISYSSRIPQYLIDLIVRFNSLRAKEGPLRVLYLPTPDFYIQVFGSSSLPDHFNLNSLGDPVLLQYLLEAFSYMIGDNTTRFGSLLAPVGYKYIVVLKLLNQSLTIQYETFANHPYGIAGNPSLFTAFLEKQIDISLVKSTAEYDIYVNNAISARYNGVFWLHDGNLSANIPNSTILLPRSPPGDVEIINMIPTHSPSKYVLAINSSGPVWLVFNQRYDAEWVAYLEAVWLVFNQSHDVEWTAYLEASDRSILNHTKAMGWANAFYIPGSGTRQVILSFRPQYTLDLIWNLWVGTTVFLGVICINMAFGQRLAGLIWKGIRKIARWRLVKNLLNRSPIKRKR